jgi:hypothetical protein
MGQLSNPPETLENLADQGCYGSSSTRPESPKSLKPSSGSPGSGYSNNKGRLSNPVQRRLTRPQLAQLAEAYAAGSSINALARTYRVHRTTVISQLDRLAVPRRRVIRKMTDDGSNGPLPSTGRVNRSRSSVSPSASMLEQLPESSGEEGSIFARVVELLGSYCLHDRNFRT